MPDFLSLSLWHWLCGRVGGTGVIWGYLYVFVRVEVYVRVQVLFERRCVCACSGVYAYVYLRMSLCICSNLSLCENTLITNPLISSGAQKLKCALTTPSSLIVTLHECFPSFSLSRSLCLTFAHPFFLFLILTYSLSLKFSFALTFPFQRDSYLKLRYGFFKVTVCVLPSHLVTLFFCYLKYISPPPW